MANAKVRVYKSSGDLVGYFEDPSIITYQQGEYEIKGSFFFADNTLAQKVEFNPQSLPYQADLAELANVPHKRVGLVYVQRGRQPVVMTGVANAPARVY